MARQALTTNLLNRLIKPIPVPGLEEQQTSNWRYQQYAGKPAKSARITAAWTQDGHVMIAARGPAGDSCEHMLTCVLVSDENGRFD